MRDPEQIARQLGEGIAAEVSANLLTLNGELAVRLKKEAWEAGVSPLGTPAQKLTILLRVAGELSDEVSPKCACREGCNHCCKQSVLITYTEAKLLAEHTGRKMVSPKHSRTPRTKSKDVSHYQDKYYTLPCPFTAENGSCSVYDVRPFACRTCFNLSNTSSLCDTSKGIQDVPNLDLRVMWVAHAHALQNVVIDDIRVFFPMKGGMK